jgi:hypothetical protein
MSAVKAARLRKTREPVKPSRRKPALSKSRTDLVSILDALDTARALVAVSLVALTENEDSGQASTVLRLGVEALDDVYDRLDAAIVAGRKGSAS